MRIGNDGMGLGLKLKIMVFLLLLLSLATKFLANGVETAEFRSRRQAYASRTADGVTVLFNAPEEDLREFVPDKNFYYFTGTSAPGGILVLSPRHSQHKETLFIPERNLDQEKWTGAKQAPGIETARLLNIDRVLPLEQFQTELNVLMAGQKKIYAVLPGHKSTANACVQENQIAKLRGLFPFVETAQAAAPIAHLRMTKSAAELALLRRAIQITIAAQEAASRTIADGRYEYEVEAALEFELRRAGATRPAFPSIVGSGPNSVILHYEKNTRPMRQGELVVVDIGAEFAEYAADVTRTYPVGGTFSPRQKEIYLIVLAAQEAALRAVKPGVIIGKSGPIHRAAYETIDSQGKDLNGGALGQYFIHGTSHHLGLEVHDAVSEPNRALEPGMVITIEPGIYIPGENLGVRIEDVVLVTETGYELLTKDLPRTPEDIEKLMRKRRI
ncbi:MAG: aminopeptidase P family protein [Acidimicrobiia bacterium]|nr:aminopeptidase P family protein [Acidimicrobiia bacterium]